MRQSASTALLGGRYVPLFLDRSTFYLELDFASATHWADLSTRVSETDGRPRLDVGIGDAVTAALRSGKPAIVEIPIDPEEFPTPATAVRRETAGKHGA